MDNKLSELSKPVAWKIHGHDYYYLEMREEEVTAAARIGRKGEPVYSQEYVSALLAELEQANKRAEVESVGADKSAADCVQWMKRTEAAEKRIAELEGDKRQLNEIINTEANRADAAEKQLVYSRDAISSWERKAISNFEECAKMSQRIEELEQRLATPVRLPEPCVYEVNGTRFYDRLSEAEVIATLREQGFTVGDE